MSDREAQLAEVRRHWEHIGSDMDISHEMYHDDGQYRVQLLDFRGVKVARERIYVMDGWEAPGWRAPWRSETPADLR